MTPSDSTSHTTESSLLPVDGGDVHGCQDGPRDAPVLLLIHGSASSARSWDALVPLLTGSHRVIRIDLLGHGRSAKPHGDHYALPGQARRVAAVMDLLGVRRAVVAGHSSGGVAATALAELRAMTYHSLTATMAATSEYLARRALPERLAELGKPLLVLFGADDRRWRSSSADRYRVVPGARVELLPGLGHSPILEDPPRTAASLLTFTARHAARAD
ncbi:alpha/beta fold hydrolase [Nonomuraea sp. NPDC048882]|uniref:alpha/beta fold hydrolase n=1 Tax=Nonomuraea sp. NPDC048882 TaxID=3154347 RepID=UPI0033D505E7